MSTERIAKIKEAVLRRKKAIAEIRQIWRQDRNEEMDLINDAAPVIHATKQACWQWLIWNGQESAA